MPPSPCTGVCIMDGNVCAGCGRTLEEIASWSELSEKEQQQRIEQLADE